ncbi:putative isomerase YbhE [Melanomma pulvis-pyrius CBS 109.77]|uniref:Putative isomerase YbhE n=1 Tax=Melanomma pulvis-pyrius CBS 109.77 TaxID=1314802 RepID=A0A6A6X9Y9_9PLEO|nr:putative isomerase YbhE [Melanomma pulvis-pyrius CBS 109.77]
MLPTTQLLVPFFGGLATAAQLYATHYSGTVNQLTFSGTSLTLTSSTKTNNNLPAWISYDSAGKGVYVTDETWTAQTGSLVGFSIGASGALTQSGKVTTPQGVVASALYGGDDGRSYIVNAHYQTSQITTFKLPLSNTQPLQTFKYSMNGVGAVPSRQEAPHPHGAMVDPTGEFLIVTDLGADTIRIYKIEKATGKLTDCPSAKPPAGTGPRHSAFWVPSAGSSRIRRAEGTMLFVANELSNTVSAWSVTYPSGGCLTLALKQTLSPYANNAAAPRGTKVGEVRVKDNFVYTSNRNDKKFGAQADSITQYTISSSGSITFTENTSSYSWYPRTFDINKAGDYVAIGGQTTANVAIVKRDVVTGKLTGQVANLRIGSAGSAENEDGVSAVVWAE